MFFFQTKKLKTKSDGDINSSIKLFFKFIKTYGSDNYFSLLLLFVGAVFAGLLELTGLLMLYLMIRVLINFESLEESHFVKQSLDMLGIQQLTSAVITLGLAVTCIFILKNLYIICYYYFQNLLLKKWKIKISSLLMNCYLSSPYEKLINYDSPTIVRNINLLVPEVITGFVLSGLNFFCNIIIALIILSALIFNYFTLTIFIGSLFIIGTITQNYLLKKKSIELGREKNKLQSIQNKHIFQGFHSLKETKVYQKEKFFLNNFTRSHNMSVINDTKTDILSRAPTHITEILLIISLITICSFIIIDNVNNPEMSVATLGLLAAISFRTAPLMNRTVSAAQNLNRTLPSINKLFAEFEKFKMKTETETKGETISFQNNITFDNVSYSYPNTTKSILKDISFSINKGEKLAIVGVSGAGKSTLVSILLGLLKPTHGTVTVDNSNLNSIIDNWRGSIGYVPQDVYISDDTIENNIAFGLQEDEIDYSKIEKSIKDVNLEQLNIDLKMKNSSNLGENGKKISGGQKQRIGIARAIYREAEVLVMDEPTSSLDLETESKIMRIINNELKNRTVIFITHRISTVVNFDKILFLENGSIADFGSFENLIRNNKSFNILAKHAKII